MRIWDLPTRICHWLLALAFAAAFVTTKLGPAWMEWHLRAGELVLVLILFRLLWGCCGSQTARFTQFLKSPREVLAYLRFRAAGKRRADPGHNPAGGWMVLLMLASLLVVTVTGLYADDLVAFSGPLAACVPGDVADLGAHYHELASNVALALVGLHLFAIAFYALVLKEHLLPAMLGRPRDIPIQPLRVASPWLALVLFAAAVVGVAWVASGAICTS